MKDKVEYAQQATHFILGKNFKMETDGKLFCMTERSHNLTRKTYIPIQASLRSDSMVVKIPCIKFTKYAGVKKLPDLETLFNAQVVSLRQEGTIIAIYLKLTDQFMIHVGSVEDDVTVTVPYLFSCVE